MIMGDKPKSKFDLEIEEALAKFDRQVDEALAKFDKILPQSIKDDIKSINEELGITESED
jgi:GTP-binding protein EngB required for normal cell division